MSIAFALKEGERCRNYGPEHERTENENSIVILADEVLRLREALAMAVSGLNQVQTLAKGVAQRSIEFATGLKL